uniref:Macaca fascicularis brain cDNA clone: QflA-20094, similar to human vacuolar protein sorting protein 18 (VPS18), mRNA, RefSeq: NM_020857.2 n=1 Tax=Macaca fascicularis TaxID=9541 RepID=I7GNA1_MACFA|nr:unnamed protein product [Macaca fascicularis]
MKKGVQHLCAPLRLSGALTGVASLLPPLGSASSSS